MRTYCGQKILFLTGITLVKMDKVRNNILYLANNQQN